MSVLPFNMVEVDIIIDNSNAAAFNLVQPIEIIEVVLTPPAEFGVKQIESIPFTHQGSLVVTAGGAEFPIGPGQFAIDSIAARVAVTPTGSSVILDILKNNATIFSDLANRPTILANQQNAAVGDFGVVMLEEGDYVECIISQVGSTTPGSDLVVSIRLERLS